MTITVSTTSYKWSHGKEPRGFGYWAFYMGKETTDSEPVWFTGKYAEAKKQAIAHAKGLGITRVIVGS